MIVGSSGHAKVIIDLIEKEGKVNILGLLDRFRNPGEEVLSYPILGAEEDLPLLVNRLSVEQLVVAIGDNFVRAEVVTRLRQICPEVSFPPVIHPSASIATTVEIGEGAVVMSGVSVNSSTTIGKFCILNTNSSLDHDSSLGDFASLAPNSVTGGGCTIGEYSAIGIAAVLIHNVEIGEHSVVGAGALVLKSIDSYQVAFGSPARQVRSRTKGEKYL